MGGVVCIAAFGYLFNDLCDIKCDAAAGKYNTLSRFPSGVRYFLVLLFITAGCVLWYLTEAGVWVKILFSLQIFALIIYSAPPFRLKEKSSWGVIADAFYGHINPALFTIGTFYSDADRNNSFFIAVMLLLTLTEIFKGVRNILLHQISDRKQDRKANVNTFVILNGPLFTLILLNKFLIPEIVCVVAFVLLISFKIPPFFLAFILFVLVTYLKFSGWKLSYLPKRQLKFKFLFFLNDFFEGWMPVSFLLILSFQNPKYLIALALHLLLFPKFILQLLKDFKTIQENFKTEEQY